MSVSRRQFVQGAGVIGASAAVASEPATAQSGGGTANVRDFGARGNGSGDDTAAIRRAAEAAAPGGTVYFPPGTYRLARRVPLRYPTNASWRNLTWQGAGAGEVTLRLAGGLTQSHFVVQLRGNVGTARFSGLTLDGNKSQQSPNPPGLCMLSEARGKVVLRDVRMQNANNAGLKFSGQCDADIQFCHFHNNGYLDNGGHAISPNQNPEKTRTYVRRCLFTQQGGVDIDTGHMTPGAAWQTCVAEECYFRGSKRGVLKISSENARTTVRNSVMDGSGEIPVKMNPTSQNIGTIELDNVIINGGGWPAVDLPCPGRLVLNEVAIKNVAQGNNRNTGIYSNAMNISGTRVSIHNVNGGRGTAVDLGGCSGSIQQLRYGSVSGVGDTAGIIQSASRGAPLQPSVVSASDCGPRDGSSPAPVADWVMGGGGQQNTAAPWQSGETDISFENTVNAVEDLGCDPEEGAVIDGKVAGVESGTLVEFPTGRYLVDSLAIQNSNVGLAANPGATPVFVPARPAAQSTNWLIHMLQGGDYVFSGITIDATQQGHGGTITVYPQQGDAYVGDVQIRGVTPNGAEGLAIGAMSSDGVAVAERFIARDGSTYDSASHGLFVGEGHAGELYIRACEVWHWSDNGVYASNPGYQGTYRGSTNADRGNGAVHVQGGIYKNNNIANIRIGSTGSTIRGAVVHSSDSVSGDAWDTREYPIMPRSGTEPQPVVNGRGIWITGREDIVVEDVDIRLEIGPASAGIAVRGAASDVTIRNTRIYMGTSAPGIRVPGGDDPLTVEDVSFSGPTDEPAALFRGREGSTVQNSCVSMPNSPGVVGLSDGQVSLTGGECSLPSLQPAERWDGQSQRQPRNDSVPLVVGIAGLAVVGVLALMVFILAAAGGGTLYGLYRVFIE